MKTRITLLAGALVALASAKAHADCGDAAINPRTLTFARQSGELTGTLGRIWRIETPYDLDDVVVEFTRTGGSGGGDVTVCRKRGDKNEPIDHFDIPHDSDKKDRTWTRPLGGVKGSIITVLVDGKSVTNKIEYQLRLKRPNQGTLRPPVAHPAQSPAVEGFADLHDHGMAHLAFGGNYVWGDPGKPLAACDGKSHAQLLGLIDVSGMATEGKHPDRTRPNVDWPHYADPSHQTMHGDHLRAAMARGLKLIVLYAVNSDVICSISSGKTQPCDDMQSARVQLVAAHEFAAKNPWFRIVRDPWEARQAIADGKLAVVLGVEVSNLMDEGNGRWEDQLDELYDLDVRALELAHETDSDFAGSAVHHSKTLKLANFLKQFNVSHADLWDKAKLLFEQSKQNPMGLKPAGRSLVRRMVERHMLIPLDHLSRATRKDVYELVTDRNWEADMAALEKTWKSLPFKPPGPMPALPKLNYYPLHASHSRFDALIDHDDKALDRKMGEYMLTDENVRFIRETGGVFGLRTGDDRLKTAPGSPVANTCHGSSRSMAQLVHYGNQNARVHMAFGTDADGFVNLVAPRFAGGRERPDNGAAVCPNGGTPDDRTKPAAKPLNKDFDQKGLAHLGMLPDLLQDMKNLGVDTKRIERSAETFLKMWERTYAERTAAPLADAAYQAW